MAFNIPRKESPDIIMLFMNVKAVQWLEKGRFELKGEKKAHSGPIGLLVETQRELVSNANILVYVLNEGKLSAGSISSNFFEQVAIGQDNKINQTVYRLKAKDVLRVGHTNSPVARGVDEFQKILNGLLSRA